jgi:hypothetical protein
MIARRTVPPPVAAIALLMVLQVGGCALIGSGNVALPIFCTAATPPLEWLGSLQGLLLAGFIPFGLTAFAFAPLRYPAIAIGLLSLAGLAVQHSLLARGLFYCDAF